MKENIIYFFLNEKEDILYIGKTTNFKLRMSQHFNLKQEEWKNKVKYIKLYFMENPVDMDIYEIYYINKYKPRYNKESKYKEYSNLILPDINNINILDINNIKISESDTQINNLNINKNFKLYYPHKNTVECHNYKYISNNYTKLKNEIYNVKHNIFKGSNKDTGIYLTYGEFSKKLEKNKNYYILDNYNYKNLIYVGFVNLNNSNNIKDLKYNSNKLIYTINKITNNNIKIYITCPKLRSYFENNYLTNKNF